MNGDYQHIANQRDASFAIERFDQHRTCVHEGLHFHHSYEIVFIKNGAGKIVVDNTCRAYENGALIFLGPCLPHLGFSNDEFEDNFEMVIHFDDVFIENRLKQIPEFHALLPFIHRSKEVILFSPAFKEEQAALFEDLDTLSPLEQLASVFKILCTLAGSTDYECLLDKPLSDHSSYNQQIAAIFEFINENYSGSMSTKDAAQHLGLTTNSFCKLFKKVTHKPFITYLNEFRIHRATNLIEYTNDSISEIAFKCGFENLSYFSKVFFRVMNISPMNYKKSLSQSLELKNN